MTTLDANGYPIPTYEVQVNVSVYRHNGGGDRMSLTQSFEFPESHPAVVFETLAEFANLAEKVKEQRGVK